MDKLGEEQVVYKGRMAVDKYARLLGDTGQLFNFAVVMNDVLVIAQLDSSNEVLPLEPVHIGLLCHHIKSKSYKTLNTEDYEVKV